MEGIEEESFGERYAELLRPIRCAGTADAAPQLLALTLLRMAARVLAAAISRRTGTSMWRASSRTTWTSWKTSRSRLTRARPS